MKKKTNLPKLRFPEFESEWEIKKLGDITDISKLAGFEYTKHVIYQDTGKIIALRALNIKNNGLDLTEVKYIDRSDFSKLHRSKLFIGDLMFTYIGANIGDVALIDENDRYYLAPNVARIRSRSNWLIYYFLLQYFNIPTFLKQEIHGYIASSSQPALSMESIRKFQIKTPSLSEQSKISSFLISIDNKINQLKKKKSLLEQYKKGVTQLLFSQKMRFKDEVGNDFEDWQVILLGECLDYIQPTKYLVSSTEYHPSYYTPVLTAGKTFLLGYTNETNGIFDDGLPVIIFDDFTTATQFVDFPFKAKSSAMKILKACPNVNIRFMYEAMQNLNYEIGGHERHWISKFSQLELLIPSLAEQTKIANFLTSLDDKITQCNIQINKMDLWKKGLLQQMFV